MALHRDPGRRFDQALRAIETVTELPPDVVALRGRLAAFTGRVGSPMTDRLAAAVVNGDTADTGQLWALAVAEAQTTPPVHNDLLQSIRRRVHAAIRERYADHAADVYQAIAGQFDAAAQGFTDAAAVCDPELDADAVIDGSDAKRRAWRAAEDHAAAMSRLLEPLHAAAMLAGVCGTDPDLLLVLTVDTEGLEPDALWPAWDTEARECRAARTAASHSAFTTADSARRSRCGRWSALHAVGARLRAHPATAVTAYPRRILTNA